MKALAGIGIAVVLVGVLFLTFVRPPAHSPIYVLIGIDTSGSARPYLSDYVIHASRLITHLEPERDALTLLRVDYETQEFYADVVRGGREAALKRFLVEVVRQPQRNRTLPETFWREVVRRSDKAVRPVCIVYFSDGDNDDFRPESQAALCELGKRLAANPRVVGVHLVGIRTANRAAWERCFAPLEHRLTLAGENEMQIDSALKQLESCRQSAAQK